MFTCASYIDGYNAYNDYGYSCLQNCKHCYDGSSCKECQHGYYGSKTYSGSECLECNENCVSVNQRHSSHDEIHNIM